MAVTEQEEKAYLDNGGNNCPKCGGDDLECDGLETDGTEAWREFLCTKCDKRFIDIYKLAGVEEKS